MVLDLPRPETTDRPDSVTVGPFYDQLRRLPPPIRSLAHMAWCMSCFYSALLGWTPCGGSRIPILFGHPATAAPRPVWGGFLGTLKMPVGSWGHNSGVNTMQKGMKLESRSTWSLSLWRLISMRTRHGVQHTITFRATGTLYFVQTVCFCCCSCNDRLAPCLGFTRYCLDKFARPLGGALERVAGQILTSSIHLLFRTSFVDQRGRGLTGYVCLLRARPIEL